MVNKNQFSSEPNNFGEDTSIDTEAQMRSNVQVNPENAPLTAAFAGWLVKEGKLEDALLLLQEATARTGDRNLILQLASLYRMGGESSLAVNLLRPIINSDCTDEVLWGLTYHSLVDSDLLDAAEEHLKAWMQACPHDVSPSYLLASLQDLPLPDRAPREYVVQTYRQAADMFELFATQQQYKGLAAFGQILSDSLGERSQVDAGRLRIADLGCGAGALGPALEPLARELIGVDLSPEMLTFAKAADQYDQLECTDLLDFITSQPSSFDLVVAAESFNYFGDLSKLIPACLNSLNENGWLVFSLQEGPLAEEGYYLLANGSFMHSPAYVVEQLGEAGLSGGTLRRVVLRTLPTRTVYSLLIAVQRPV